MKTQEVFSQRHAKNDTPSKAVSSKSKGTRSAFSHGEDWFTPHHPSLWTA